jgi:hypothetical protein
MHLLKHPRNAALLGLIFVTISIIYFVVPNWLGVNSATDPNTGKPLYNILDIAAGATMLLALGIAMSLMAYVLAVGTRDE